MAKKAFKSSSVQKEKQTEFIEWWFAGNMNLTPAIREYQDPNVGGGYNLTTHYKYMQDPEYSARILLGSDKTERKLDIIEDVLFKKAEAGDTKCIFKWLDTHGQARGYGKQIEDRSSGEVQRSVVSLEVKMLSNPEDFAAYGKEAMKGIPQNAEEVQEAFDKRIPAFDMKDLEEVDLYAE